MTCSRRGYALPLVLLLALVVAMMLGLAIERNTAKSHNVARQLDTYRQHHVAKGLQEAISAWLSKQNARTITEALGEDGHAINLILPDRSIAAVYLTDGQGTLLDPQAASPSDYQRAVSLRDRMEILCRNEGVSIEDYRRPLGPFEISVNSADALLLQAVAEEVVGIDLAPELVSKILEKRQEQGQLQRQDILSISAEVGVATQQRNGLLQYLTVTPEMWYVTIELRGGVGVSSRRVTARYGGLVPVQASTSRSSVGAWEQPGAFLTWEELGVEYDGPGGSNP